MGTLGGVLWEWALYGLKDLVSVYALEVMFVSADRAATVATDPRVDVGGV